MTANASPATPRAILPKTAEVAEIEIPGGDQEAALATVEGVVTAVTLVMIVEAGAEVAAVTVTEEPDADHPGPAPVLGPTPQEIGGEMTAETTAETGGMIAEMAADVANVPVRKPAIETVEIAEVATGVETLRLGKTGTMTLETATEAEIATEPTVIETSPANRRTAQEERNPSQDLPVRVRSATMIAAKTSLLKRKPKPRKITMPPTKRRSQLQRPRVLQQQSPKEKRKSPILKIKSEQGNVRRKQERSVAKSPKTI